jgi:hypothetical protein
MRGSREPFVLTGIEDIDGAIASDRVGVDFRRRVVVWSAVNYSTVHEVNRPGESGDSSP